MRMIDKIKTMSAEQATQNTSKETSIYDIEINTLEGPALKLSEFNGRYLLFVNVASQCGFTRQYKALQSLSEEYESDLVVIGVPCNQFGSQEPGDASTIRSFCDTRFGVTFPLTEKIKVKGAGQHALYQWLTRKSLNGKKSSSVRWNFQKYLVDREGNLVDVFYSTTSPSSTKITRHL